MSVFFKNNDFNTNYKKRPFDGYKSVVEKLDEETKRKLDRQRTTGMIVVVAFVVILVAILAITGIGIDKSKSASGNVFLDKEQVLIECFGDSVTEGYTIITDEQGEHAAVSEVTYPSRLQQTLMKLLQADDHTYRCQSLDVKNYGISGSVLQKDSYTRLSGTADIVLIMYTANNFLYNEEYVGTLESNIDAVLKSGAQIFLVNYPTMAGSEYEMTHTQANNYIANTAKDYGLPLIDVSAYIAGITDYSQEELYCPDGVHLTALGYELMGDFAADVLHQYYYDLY